MKQKLMVVVATVLHTTSTGHAGLSNQNKFSPGQLSYRSIDFHLNLIEIKWKVISIGKGCSRTSARTV